MVYTMLLNTSLVYTFSHIDVYTDFPKEKRDADAEQTLIRRHIWLILSMIPAATAQRSGILLPS